MSGFLSQYLDLVVQAQAPTGLSSIGLLTGADSFLDITPINGSWLVDGAVPNLDRAIVHTIDDSNPQRFKVKSYEVPVSPPRSPASDAEAAVKHYWKQLAAKIGADGTVRGGTRLNFPRANGRATRLDMEIQHSGYHDDVLLVLQFNSKGNPKHDTHFCMSLLDDIELAKPAHKALFAYAEETQQEHLLRQPYFVDNGLYTVVTICRMSDQSDPDFRFAIAATITDTDQHGPFETDVLIDPRVRNDG